MELQLAPCGIDDEEPVFEGTLNLLSPISTQHFEAWSEDWILNDDLTEAAVGDVIQMSCGSCHAAGFLDQYGQEFARYVAGEWIRLDVDGEPVERYIFQDGQFDRLPMSCVRSTENQHGIEEIGSREGLRVC